MVQLAWIWLPFVGIIIIKINRIVTTVGAIAVIADIVLLSDF